MSDEQKEVEDVNPDDVADGSDDEGVPDDEELEELEETEE